MSNEVEVTFGDEVVEVVAAPAPDRKVTFGDEVVDFGVRANVLVHTDLETKTISFLLFNGSKVDWVIEGIDGFTPFQVQVYLYGLAAKVKSSLAPLKDLTEIEVAIAKQIASIDSGVFILRSGKDAVLSLSDIQQAYAAVKSSTPEFAHWADTTNPEVIKEVLDRWETFSTSEKNSIRKNAYVKLALANIRVEQVKEETLI